MKQAAIFDMDGTLFQTQKILAKSLEDVFEYLRQTNRWSDQTPIDKYNEIMGVPLPVVWETLLPNHSIEVRNYINELFHDCLIENINLGNGDLYPNVIEIFTFLLENNFQVFIASNGQSNYLNTIIDYYQLNHYITEVFSIQQINSIDKGILAGMILEKYNLSNGFVIGDRLSDILSAKKNALTAIGCRFDFAQEEELKHADYIINDLEEIKSIMDQYHVLR
jgi:phosphoglycolate phosphatase-like HAD superfamily hydrolase